MTKKLVDFHHYKGESLSRSEQIERTVVDMLLNSSIADVDRESSITFELKHSSSCGQLAKILAQKRSLDVELAVVTSILHDIHVIEAGDYANHAVKGAVVAKRILEDQGDFTDEEISTITNAIAHHSEKDKYDDNPYVELVKDVDVFDCSLYKGAENFYRIHKPPEIVDHYVARIKKVRAELNLQVEPVFIS